MTDQSALPVWTHPLSVADLAAKRTTLFKLQPDSKVCAAIADAFGWLGVRKLQFKGQIQASGKTDWVLSGRVGATLTQACVVTLDPVMTRLDMDVTRRYVSENDAFKEGSETEIPEDVTIEPLGSVIDPGLVMVETLSLLAPEFPRSSHAALEKTVFSEPGITPMSDAEARPFAALKSLVEKPDGPPE